MSVSCHSRSPITWPNSISPFSFGFSHTCSTQVLLAIVPWVHSVEVFACIKSACTLSFIQSLSSHSFLQSFSRSFCHSNIDRASAECHPLGRGSENTKMSKNGSLSSNMVRETCKLSATNTVWYYWSIREVCTNNVETGVCRKN